MNRRILYSAVEFHGGAGAGDELAVLGGVATTMKLVSPTGLMSSGRVEVAQFGEVNAIDYTALNRWPF